MLVAYWPPQQKPTLCPSASVATPKKLSALVPLWQPYNPLSALVPLWHPYNPLSVLVPSWRPPKKT